MHDVRLPNAGQTLFYPGSDERWRSPLSSEPARDVQRAGDEILCGRSDTRTRAYAP